MIILETITATKRFIRKGKRLYEGRTGKATIRRASFSLVVAEKNLHDFVVHRG